MPISPNQGPTSGGTTVTITGVNLANATAVRFGTKPASILSNTPTSLTVSSPAGTGVAAVTVTTAGGTSNPLSFFYISPPFLTSLAPESGSTAGGDTVNIYGLGLSTALSVDFGGNSATPTIISDSLISVVVPAGTSPGSVMVSVQTSGGTSNTLSYVYVDAPTITAISPSSGPASGGTTLTIVGTDLASATGVTIGGVPASFAVINPTTVVAVAPAGTPGAADVVVTTTGGSATAVGGYTYVAGPGI